MHYLRNFFGILFTTYAFIFFIAFLLCIFPIVIVASFFGKVKGGNFIYNLCRIWSQSMLLILGIYHRTIYENPHDPHKQYVFVLNHISFLDIPVMLNSIRKQPIRILGKVEMAKIPIFGFVYRKAVVLVDRENAEKRAKSVLQLKSILKKGISIVLYPEGTFNITHTPLAPFYDGAFKIAIETKTSIKPIIFLDTYDRMHYKSIFSITPGKSRAVYLEEVKVDGLTINDIKILKEKVYHIMESALLRHKASWVK